MIDARTPEMSVVLVTPDRYETVRKTVLHLRAQTVSDRIELIVCAPSAGRLGLVESEVECFMRVRVVEVGEVRRMARAKVAGVAAARAPVVAFAEDHCFPAPDWAARLIEAHGRGWAAVGPAMLNANPRTALSWAGLYLNYANCLDSSPSRASPYLPWHNISYRRDVLLEYGDELAAMLAVEGVLLDDLRARGRTLYFESAAKTSHVNISRLTSWIRHAFWGGRLFGAARARKKNWTARRRAVYVCGGWLIPFVRLWRTLPVIRRTVRGRGLLPRMLPAMLAGLIPHALGEMAGYAFGVGDAERRYSFYEMKRTLHVTKKDRRELES
jgi:hypothetical protein